MIESKVNIDVNVLVERFLRQLQQEGSITNEMYLEAIKKLKEEKNVH